MKRLLLLAVVLLIAAYALWPVGGKIWRQSQVTGVELTRMSRTVVIRQPAAIAEALGEARLQRFFVFHLRPCRTVTVTFLTELERVPVQIKRPSGFFLDFVAPNE